jgi:hypothetical protein
MLYCISFLSSVKEALEIHTVRVTYITLSRKLVKWYKSPLFSSLRRHVGGLAAAAVTKKSVFKKVSVLQLQDLQQ